MKKPIPALIPFLVFISMVFIGILIYVYIQTKKANPQMIETASLRGASFQLAMPAFVPAYPVRAGLRPQPGPPLRRPSHISGHGFSRAVEPPQYGALAPAPHSASFQPALPAYRVRADMPARKPAWPPQRRLYGTSARRSPQFVLA